MKYSVWTSNCCGAPMEHIDGEDKCGYCGKIFSGQDAKEGDE